jgi:CO/xanthine dehydrogenase Mo-binding subunit
VSWDEGPNAKINSADIWNDLRAASKKDGVVAKSEGDIDTGLTRGERFDANYELPLLAHATMEPMNCTVRLTPGACEIWTGTQVQSRCQDYAAKAAGLPIDKVTVNNHYLGGGFGRRLEPDMVESAVRIAKLVSNPIKVVWTREEDMQHDVYRPVATRFRLPFRTVRSSPGNIRSPARQCSRAGFRPHSGTALTATPSIARWTCRTTSRTSASNMCAPSRQG